MDLKNDELNDNNVKPQKERIVLGVAVFLAVLAVFFILTKLWRNLIIWVVNAMLFGFGIWCIVGYPKQLRINKKNVTELVSAIVSEVKEIVHSGMNGKWRTYFATYEFKFKGRSYKVQSEEEYDEKPRKGINIKLLINPNKPTEIYEVESEKIRIKIMKCVGVIFIVCGFFMLVNNFV